MNIYILFYTFMQTYFRIGHLITAKSGDITTTKQNKDQYARYIAEVTYNDTNMSDYLIDKGVAKLWKG